MKEEKTVTIGLHMNDTPLSVYKEFKKDIHKYNNTYWIKLMDLMRKSEAYDKIMEIRIITEMKDDFEPEQKKEVKPKTLGGLEY